MSHLLKDARLLFDLRSVHVIIHTHIDLQFDSLSFEARSCQLRTQGNGHLDHVIREFLWLNEAVSILCGLSHTKAAELSVPRHISDDQDIPSWTVISLHC